MATKSPTKVVILTGRSLFAGAIANRLRRCVDVIEIKVTDLRPSSVLVKLTEILPSVVILDATDAEVEKCCSLDSLLAVVPTAKIIRLDPQREQIHVLTSEHHLARHVDDLIEVIGTTD